MKQIFFIFTSLLYFLFVMDLKAETIDASLYIVDNIKIEKTSVTAKDAKDLAILEGQRNALAILFERLSIKKENLQFIGNDILSQMVDSIEIKDEVLTSIKYSSRLLVSFNREFVDYYLNNLQITKNKIANKIYLYIPILKQGNNFSIIKTPNLWRDGSVKVILEKQYEDIILLNNNPANENLIKDNIENGNYDDFAVLLKNHKANVVVLSIAEYRKESDSIEINFKQINALETTEIKLNFFNKEMLSFEDLFHDGSNKVLAYLNEAKEKEKAKNNNIKEVTLISDISNIAKDKELSLHLVFGDLEEFIFLKNVLKNLSFITDINIRYISTKEAFIDLKFDTFIEEVYTLFKEQNLLLKFKDNEYYLIYLGV